MESDIPSDLIGMYAKVIAEHRVWFQQFDKGRLKKWEDLLKNNSEAAICEAATRKLLSDNTIEVKPCNNYSGKSPDYICTKGDKQFYVEVTCVSINKLTNKCGMPPDRPADGGHYPFLLTDVLLGEICNKTPQCSDLNSPCILCVGTLHYNAGSDYFGKLAAMALLTGTPQFATNWNPETGDVVGDPHQITNLRDSAFIRFTKKADGIIEYARTPISAVLLCPFVCLPVEVVGMLHPNPNHPFDRALLPKIEFCRLVEGYQNGLLTVEWI